MKKKSLFLLASVAMGAALVGGTFASWAVTDNADPFSIKVSTGNISTDATEYVTLEWGEQQSMSHVSNLAANTIRKAGVLDLRANTASTNSPNGTLSYSATGGSHLLAKLQINVYSGNLAATDGVIAASTVSELTPVSFTSGSAVLTVSKNAANLYTVAVSLATVTAPELQAMAGEEVSIQFDWGAGTNLASFTTLYAHGFSGQPYAYAWTDATQNAAWPGVAMEEVVAGSGYYKIAIPAALQNVIFSYDNDYADEANRQQSADLAIASTFTGGKNMYTYGEQDPIGTFNPASVTPSYYVVGDFTTPDTWKAYEANKMDDKTNGVWELASVTLAAGAELKVFNSSNNMYYGCASTWENCGFSITADGNLKITAAGSYKINFYLEPSGGNYVVPTKL